MRNVIKSARCDICALQETKGNRVDFTYVSRFLPSFFSYEVAFNLAANSARGVLIAWRRSFSLLSSWSTKHTLTVLLQHDSSNCIVLVTNAYGSTEDTLKPAFMHELSYLASLVANNWLLVGDFNISGNQRSFRLMEMFNDFVRNARIIDVPLQNRAYTWCSNRPQPVFSKIDLVFMTPDWSSQYPIISLQGLEVIVSNHVPLLLTCKGLHQSKRRFQLESFWFKYRKPKLMVQNLWDQTTLDNSVRFTPSTIKHKYYIGL